MLKDRTNRPDPEALALSALGWVLADGNRAQRLLGLTGLTPEDLRGRLGERALLAAILRFLEAHEPDLVACAEALQMAPAHLVGVRQELEA